MFESPGVYIALLVLMLVVTGFRLFMAGGYSKEQKEKETAARTRLQANADRMEQTAGAHADASFSSAGSVLKLDKTQGKLYYATAGGNASLDLSAIASVEFEDHSVNYRHCQEMARLHKGVERSSLLVPFGKHSAKEVREGARKLADYSGRVIYGINIRCRNGDTVSLPGYKDSGTLFWEEEQQREAMRDFAEELRRAL